MPITQDFLALDLGATSGRACLGSWDGHQLHIREIHRFPNGPIEINGELHWDLAHLTQEVDIALQKAAALSPHIVCLGCDTWGLDTGFLDSNGSLLEQPYSYQEQAFQGGLARMDKVLPREKIITYTAAPCTSISTLGQLLTHAEHHPELLKMADRMLFMPDLIHHHLTGESATESCITSTSQLTNWKTLDWDWDLIELCHLPKHLFPPIHPTGTLLGPLSSALAERLKVPRWQVCQTGGHDTACAVAAAPLSSTPELVISSGTWSMLGIEVAEPIISAEAAQLVCGSYVIPGPRWCFMRGVMGLWLLERFRHEENLGPVGELVAGASQSRSKSCLFDPQAELFQSSLSFREALTQWCIATRQPIPQETSGIVRSILESLALFCHEAMENLAKLAGRELRQVVIVGGGSRNRLLNQLIANATGLPVRVGHAESTVIGNLLCQAVGMGALTSFDEIRGVVNCSFPTEEYLPQDQEQREEKRDRYRKVKGCE